MDITQLNERYPKGIPEALQDGISKFTELSKRKGIKSITLMSNFSLDLEQTLSCGTDVYKGLIVQALPGYKLSSTDRLWLHPQLSKTRSVYHGSVSLEDVSLPDFNSSVGQYNTFQVDELGAQTMEKYTIVDTPFTKSKTFVNHWITSQNAMRDVCNDYKDSELVKATEKEHDKIASGLQLKSRQTYVALYKGANVYHFYNHVIKCNGEAMVLQSPLMGYSMVSRIGDVASDACTELMDVNKLTQANRDRIYSDCSWSGKNLANTYVMRKGEVVKGEAFRMVNCRISSNNIVDKLDTATVLKLTPTSKNIPANISCDKLQLNDVLRFGDSDEIALKLLKENWRSMISSKFFKDGSLLVPRKMVEKHLI
tara:strand:+ start:2103 stop:3206 length:1104 start_codon:yes stop_codon:yes gene_type:complete